MTKELTTEQLKGRTYFRWLLVVVALVTAVFIYTNHIAPRSTSDEYRKCRVDNKALGGGVLDCEKFLTR